MCHVLNFLACQICSTNNAELGNASCRYKQYDTIRELFYANSIFI